MLLSQEEINMKYVNANDILPKELLDRIKPYAAGKLIYIPAEQEKRAWGEKTGARAQYYARNNAIRMGFSKGMAVDVLADKYFLTPETIKKIIYAKEKEMKDKQFPEIMFDYKIAPCDKPVPTLRLNKHPIYETEFKAGAVSKFAAYPYPYRRIADITESTAVGETTVHGERGMKFEIIWNKGESEYEVRCAVISQIKGDICRHIAAETYENNETQIRTCLEGDAFFEDWGGDMPLVIEKRGLINKCGNSITFTDENVYSDAVGRYTVTMNGKEYDTVLVVNASGYDAGVVTEEYLDLDGNSILFRRFDRGTLSRVQGEACFSEHLPDSERIFVNGNEFVLWIDTISEKVC